jgi:serpin B
VQSELLGKKSAHEKVSAGEVDFACDLIRVLGEREGNLFFSPYSIAEAMALANDGAAGVTREEIARAVHLPSAAETRAGLAELRDRLEFLRQRGGFDLSVANRLWVMSGFALVTEYVQRAEKDFAAGIEDVNFAESAKAAAKINAWVARQTRERIKDLVSSDMLSRITRLVITNAIYFKAKWDSTFEKAATRDGAFHTAGGKIKTALMHNLDRFNYAEFAKTPDLPAVQALELAYSGYEVSMLVLLPEAGGIRKLESGISAAALSKMISAMKGEQVRVTLPRFSFEDAMSLREALRSLGAKAAFEAGADFSGISPKDAIYISDVIHKTFVKVDEEGTEAAAATAVIMVAGCAAPSPAKIYDFTADRPFLFLIRDRASGTILFAGRVAEPA